MNQIEKLRALLAEAQSGLMCDRYREAWEKCDCAVCAVKTCIDAALAEPVHHKCFAYVGTTAGEIRLEPCGDVIDRLTRERDEALVRIAGLENALQVQEGFKRGAMKERDEARAELQTAEDKYEQQYDLLEAIADKLKGLPQGDGWYVHDDLPAVAATVANERNELRSEVKRAYQRGYADALENAAMAACDECCKIIDRMKRP